MIPKSEVKTWRRQSKDATFLCSTDPEYIQLEALNAAFDSNMLWWANALSIEELRKTVDNSLCFALYIEQNSHSEEDGNTPRHDMIGFARMITDYVTFAYLTDVYVLPEHQGKGLGRWLIECLQELIGAWPQLRRIMLLTTDPNAIRLYEAVLGAKDVQEAPDKLIIMQALGPAGKRH